MGNLRAAIAKYQASNTSPQRKYKHSPNIITAALLGPMCKDPDVDWRIAPESCFRISSVDSMRAAKRGLFGGGFLISERAAAERAAAIEAEEWPLSEREWEIVKNLK